MSCLTFNRTVVFGDKNKSMNNLNNPTINIKAFSLVAIFMLFSVSNIQATEVSEVSESAPQNEVSDTLSTESNQGGGFGSPNTVENLLADDALHKKGIIKELVLQPWIDWKKSLQEDYGLSFGIDYSSVFFGATEKGASGDDIASSGIVRFFGAWDIFGKGTKNTGALVWKVEHRHSYTDIAPSEMGFDLGYDGLIQPAFSDQGLRLTNLYWRQRLNDGKITFMAGFLDATDYVDVFAMASPWTGFNNFAFSTGTTTMFLPNDATLGLAGGAMLTDNLYIIAGITNAYSDPTNPFDGFSRFFDENEYFTSIEFGWTSSQGRIYHDNVHLTFWHVDESEKAGTPDGWGVNFQFVTQIYDSLMPFVRAGYADDSGSLMQKSVSVGLGYEPVPGEDQLGFAFNWGEPNEASFGSDVDDQYTIETFYRFQLTPRLALTPNVQYLIDPALDPDQSDIWLFGLRARLAL